MQQVLSMVVLDILSFKEVGIDFLHSSLCFNIYLDIYIGLRVQLHQSDDQCIYWASVDPGSGGHLSQNAMISQSDLY